MSSTVVEGSAAADAPLDAPGASTLDPVPLLGPVELLDLKPLPENQQGTSTATFQNYTASVSNKSGYLCHIHTEVTWDIPPHVIFQIFTHPDNAGVFRSIRNVGYRNVTEERPGWKVVEVEQVGELKVMWIRRLFSTFLTVIEDSTNPEKLVTTFTLLKSDVLGKFQGSWELTPIRDPVTRAVVGCKGLLQQDVLPKGMPTFLQKMPVLGGLLRKVSLGTIKDLMDDLNYVANRYKEANQPLDALLHDIAIERGHKAKQTGSTTHKHASHGNQQQHGHKHGHKHSHQHHGGHQQQQPGHKVPQSFAVDHDSDEEGSSRGHSGSHIGTDVKSSSEGNGSDQAAAGLAQDLEALKLKQGVKAVSADGAEGAAAAPVVQ